MFLSLDGLGNLGPGPPSQRHWLSTVKSCLPLRGITGHLIHWQPGREGDSSDYPILQGCTVSRVQGCLHCAMLTLRTEAKNSPATHPLKYLSPFAFTCTSFQQGDQEEDTDKPNMGSGDQGGPSPQHQVCQGRRRASLWGLPPTW